MRTSQQRPLNALTIRQNMLSDPRLTNYTEHLSWPVLAPALLGLFDQI
jgi:hypothetical protein